MPSPTVCVRDTLVAKLDALLTEFDTVADEMKEQQEHDPAQRERFQHAKGETMFGADGTSVHTRHADGTKRELQKLQNRLKEPRRKPVNSLLRYLARNRDRMNYCERLRLGRVIGIGMVEGARKNLVGRRLKQTGACWRVVRVNKMAVIVAALYTGQPIRQRNIPTKVLHTRHNPARNLTFAASLSIPTNF